ncbi:MAG: molybdopterin-dependent oxidoreductase [Chloroflexi bacterium]|nr:molybdopterin-dependent oxidoreductase [Chloroflexota bacterium]MCL5273750.1 molybdopterin-dependent oxidoreductase [Chloroflexota bacterium]
MNIQLTINGTDKSVSIEPEETLLQLLRREGYYSVKHGCETGECGACSVIYKPPASEGAAPPSPRMVNTCVMLASQADGAEVTTVESLGNRTQLSALQQAFIENGAIQCGYCTPSQLLAAKVLLDKNPRPTEAEVRDALSGVLCRCTGYVKPVQAVLNAAAILRGDDQGKRPALFTRVMAPGGSVAPPTTGDIPWGAKPHDDTEAKRQGQTQTDTLTTALPPFVLAPEPQTSVVGKAEKKVDAAKLAQGKQAFVDDYPMPGMLYAAMLTSPHAHARIKDIRTARARALQGVHAVLTYKDVKRVLYASGGQSYPNPPPYDQVSLDNKVRHVGDRVAVVAAESMEIANRALELIEVDYEPLPAVFDPDEAFKVGAPVIHDEPDAIGIKDPARNLVAEVHALVGDIRTGLAESDVVIEREYRVPQAQQASIEPHICMTWFDEDDRLVVRTSTQVPFHVRRMLAPLIGLPVKRIRVIKPRIGGGFGGKQEMLIEDLCAHLTLATGRPVRFEYTREQEFISARSRHPQRMVYTAGFTKAGILHALRLYVLGNTGAYGTHGITVQTVSGLRGLSTYRCPHMEFDCDIVYTNIPTPGAFRGYGAPQAEFGLECLMDEAAERFHMDPVEFRRRNWVRIGDSLPLAKALGEAKEGFDQVIKTCALEECHQQGMAAIGWHKRDQLRIDPKRPTKRRGIGVATCMHGTAIAGLDMGAASIKMNDDGSFNVLVGGTDIGTGSDTVIGQIAAETLGVPLEDIIVYSSDTDFTPFDVGAYASSTTFITGGAAKKTAEQVLRQIQEVAARMFSKGYGQALGGAAVSLKQGETVNLQDITLHDRKAWAPDGRSITLEQIALFATHQEDQHQIMATASHMSYDSPPPFGAQFADVEVDMETGEVTVNRLVMAVDCGVAINPATASGQIEGGNLQACGYGISEEMVYDKDGSLLNRQFGPYRIYSADETPDLQAILVQTYEPSGPYGAKAVAEIPMDGVAPAIANAVFHATGHRFYQIPLTPERVWRGLRSAAHQSKG